MAIFIPSTKPESFNNSRGERVVYEALRTLNDQHTIFYSLNWVGHSDRWKVGEADFVILHPSKGILVIEVKSGEIEYREGEWIQTNTKTRESHRISPFTQARKNQFALKEMLESCTRNYRLPMSCYCVWFPSVDISAKAILPPESPKSITLDIGNLENAEKAIDDVYEFWAQKYGTVNLDAIQFRHLVTTLCPHFHVVPKLKTKAEDAEKAYILLTKQQAALLDYLEEQKTAVIHGLAGTGKTVLAVEKAKRLASQTDPVLFLCFNSLLRTALKDSNVIPNVTFHNAHSLAFEIMGHSDSPIDAVLSEFQDYLEFVFDADSWRYSNIVIDEGQDLDDRLLNRLYELVKKKSGCFYVFYDRNQYVLRNKIPQWIENAECRLVLHKNCRNTAEVFKTSCSIIGLESATYNDIHGETPTVRFFKTEAEQQIIVEGFIKRMTNEGLSADDIVILSMKTVENSWIPVSKSYAGYPLTSNREKGKILYTTIRKFKGLEAEAVLIVDAAMSSLISPEAQRLLYVGSSRAKNLLNIAMLEDIAVNEIGDYLRNLAPDRSVPKNIKGFKRLLNVMVER